MRIGLSGGVGSGKSTVAALLAGHGAVVIDADQLAREVLEPGTAGLDAVLERFGADLLVDGRLDRSALAKIVFNDDDARAALNAIVHPLVGQRTQELTAAVPVGAVAVYDVPLLVESGAADGFDKIIMVLSAEDVRLRRLEQRGMAGDDARARMSKQASDTERRAVADEIVTNDGSRAELAAQVDALWARLTGGR